MSSVVSSVLGGQGGNSGGAGLGYNAASANIQTPATTKQATDAYNQSQNAIQQQQSLLQALQGQNGIGNQSNVYNQLSQISQGKGPNPALTELSQATGQNTANQAALMAGQRGSSANAGLIARQTAQQGATNQQNAAGQAATIQANESLGALGQMGNLATTQVGQQQGAVSGLNQAAQGEQGNLLNSIAGQNSANVNMVSNQNNANAGISQIAAKNQGNLLGGALNGLTGAIGLAEGGEIKPQHLFDGGNTGYQQVQNPNGPKSAFATAMRSASNAITPSSNDISDTAIFSAGQGLGKALGNGVSSLFTPSQIGTPNTAVNSLGDLAQAAPFTAAQGGRVPALLSPGEVYLNPKDVKKVKKGNDPIQEGKKVPGKPKHPGNDYRNDVVPATLQSGGIVIPNNILQSKNPHKAAAKFVQAVLAKDLKHSKKRS